jgi:hypothetical protein
MIHMHIRHRHRRWMTSKWRWRLRCHCSRSSRQRQRKRRDSRPSCRRLCRHCRDHELSLAMHHLHLIPHTRLLRRRLNPQPRRRRRIIVMCIDCRRSRRSTSACRMSRVSRRRGASPSNVDSAPTDLTYEWISSCAFHVSGGTQQMLVPKPACFIESTPSAASSWNYFKSTPASGMPPLDPRALISWNEEEWRFVQERVGKNAKVQVRH